MAVTRYEIQFSSEQNAADFVRWAEQAWGVPNEVLKLAEAVEQTLLANGWTRHGYLDDTFVPPGHYYNSHGGIFAADNPEVIAGKWRCRCGYETDRLANAEGHIALAKAGRTLDRPGPHEIQEIERRGPEHREFGESPVGR